MQSPSAAMRPAPWPLPGTVPAGLSVWRVPLDLDRPAPAEDWAVLSADEAARARRLRQPADGVRSVRARAALRRLLGERLGVPAPDVPLGTGPWGRPRLASGTGPDFNVSHSGDCVLIALSERGLAVGVDIERIDAILQGTPAERSALEALVLSPREQAIAPAARPAFPDVWTAKEAVLKCLGVGVAEHLAGVSLEEARVAPWLPARGPADTGGEAPQEGRRLRVWMEGALQGFGVQACTLAAPAGYAAALAWSDPLGWPQGTPIARSREGASAPG
ncbi:4'-phosphopantetheinyl transferase family protein [Acidovorax sp. NCPPB 4044]|uniref:4'-phosphopantetheinyl transferase family protein n=1 Tax=Acidovorax sp. NCPPB 4044 TaxID=2940490 RepID=UPI002302188E|nr:4'-phosphopantetheinyl transferase superfamily protein [Acidovorax sp. NCPPB 4044]MDA8522135.1 4'-phosphopantetheinyl transferase superfamily protein [Acidovorax sp. NCPPB 4044]